MKAEETDTQKDSLGDQQTHQEDLFTEIVVDQDQETHQNLRRGILHEVGFLNRLK